MFASLIGDDDAQIYEPKHLIQVLVGISLIHLMVQLLGDHSGSCTFRVRFRILQITVLPVALLVLIGVFAGSTLLACLQSLLTHKSLSVKEEIVPSKSGGIFKFIPANPAYITPPAERLLLEVS